MNAPQKIGIVGAGTMGSGIAQKTAQSGLKVILLDLKDEYVERGLSGIEKMLAKGLERGVFREGEPEQILQRITGVTEPEKLRDCDLVIEAVFEDLDVKKKLMETLEKHLKADAILATNTSSFEVEAVAEGLAHPERVVGLHYFFHPAQNRLLEVIPGPQTSDEVVTACNAFAEATGKTAIHSQDAPGFVVNRFFVPWLNESVRMLEEGISDLPTIENAAKQLFGIGMGPFQLMNVTGVPIAKHAAEGLASELGPFYAPCDLLVAQVAGGKDWIIDGTPSKSGVEEIEARYLGVVLLVAASLVDEGVSSPEDTDIGAMVGLRWPRGPFALANRKGIETSLSSAKEIAKKYDLPLPNTLASRLDDNRPFALKAANLRVDAGIATITMNRPSAMNALSPETVASLAEAFDNAAADSNVSAIVIEGRGKAFVAGADIKFFIRGIDDGDIPRIVDFTREGHALLMRIDKCEKPVVARLNGMALGGGFELALACDAIVADERAVVGFPETGIGIYPGLGGTQRTVKRAGTSVARYMIFTGDIIPAGKAANLGLVDRVASSGTSMAMVRELLEERAVKAGAGAGELAQPGEAKTACEAFYSDLNAASMLSGTFEATDKAGEKAMKKIRTKAPIAMEMAAELLNQAQTLPIEDGVAKELESLPRIFATQDARRGLDSIGKERPEFKGN